jgi:transcriptional regulator with XRE-family HTH domain
MGRARRPQPLRLAEKLLTIRQLRSSSQSQMARRLEISGTKLHAPHISEYESGKREPPLTVLLEYARAAGVIMDVLVDDKLDLPTKLRNVKGRNRRFR